MEKSGTEADGFTPAGSAYSLTINEDFIDHATLPSGYFYLMVCLVASGANFLGTDRSTITRLRTESEDDACFMSSSCHLHIIFICLVLSTGKGIIILGVSTAMHGRHDSTTPDHVIVSSSRLLLLPEVDYKRIRINLFLS